MVGGCSTAVSGVPVAAAMATTGRLPDRKDTYGSVDASSSPPNATASAGKPPSANAAPPASDPIRYPSCVVTARAAATSRPRSPATENP